jgi:hypothetical protein
LHEIEEAGTERKKLFNAETQRRRDQRRAIATDGVRGGMGRETTGGKEPELRSG